MAMERMKIPITMHERLKGILRYLLPDFYKTTVPDPGAAELLHKIAEHGNSPNTKGLSREKRAAAHEYWGFVRDLFPYDTAEMSKMERSLSTRTENLKRVLEKEPDRDTTEEEKKELDDLRDYAYMSSTFAPVDDGSIPQWRASNLRQSVLWMSHRFERHGRKHFVIGEDLARELRLTDVTKVDDYFLRLPYPTVCFTFPVSTGLTIRGLPVRSMYVTERVRLTAEGQYRVLEFIMQNEPKGVQQLAVRLSGGDIMEQVVRQAEEYLSPLAMTDAKEQVSFLVAILLYLNSKDVDVQDVMPSVFNKKTDSQFPACKLGYRIKPNKSLGHPSGASTGDRQMGVVKWTVRGHFRTYRAGDRFKKDQTIWIRPFLKGRDRDNPDQPVKPTFYDLS